MRVPQASAFPVMWRQVESNVGRTGHTATPLGKYHAAVIVGGYDASNAASELTATVVDVPTGRELNIDNDGGGFYNRAGHTTVSCGENLYVYGGELVGLDGSDEGATDVLQCELDVHQLAAGESAGLAWSLLGRTPEPEAPLNAETGEVEAGYVPEPDEGPPPPRAWHGAVMLADAGGTATGEMLVYGGQALGAHGSEGLLGDVWVLNTRSGRWRVPATTGKTPPPRAHHSVTLIGGESGAVAVLGGQGKNGVPLAELFVLRTLHPIADTSEDAADGETGKPAAPATEGAAAVRPPPKWVWSTVKLQEDFAPLLRHNAVLWCGAPTSDATFSARDVDADETVRHARGAWSALRHKLVHEAQMVIFGGMGADARKVLCLDPFSGEHSELSVSGDSERAPPQRAGHASFLAHTDDTAAHPSLHVFGGAHDFDSSMMVFDVGASAAPPVRVGGGNGIDLGWARQVFEDGSTYEGNYKEGMRHGEGTMTYVDSSGEALAEYVGDWARGERNGGGVCTWATGTQYDGDWLADMRHGAGSSFFISIFCTFTTSQPSHVINRQDPVSCCVG